MTQIHELLPKVSKEIGVIRKKKTQGLNYTHRGIEDVLNVAHKVLVRNGVSVRSVVTDVQASSVVYGSNDTKAQSRIVRMKVAFIAPDGSEVENESAGEGFDTADKALGKAMSTAYKYAFFLGLCIPTESIPDVEDGSMPSGDAPRTRTERTEDWQQKFWTRVRTDKRTKSEADACLADHGRDFEAAYKAFFGDSK